MEFFNSHVLSIMTFLPLVVAAAIFIVPDDKFARVAALGGSILTFFVSLHIWHYFNAGSAKVQFVESYVWMPEFGIRAIFGVDGISLLLVMLTTALTPLVILSLWNSHVSNLRYFFGAMLALETGMLGALVALDLVFFYVFWEVMLIPMYFIIGIWGGARRIYATTKFILYTVVGSLLMLAAAIVLYISYHRQTGIYSTSVLDLYSASLDQTTQLWLFGCFALAFAIKVPMWPFHTWLPDAHVEAPTAGSVILAGVLLKMGTYGFLRFAIPMFPLAVKSFAPILVFLGVVGIIYGALTAWVQQDAKKLVAYSSVSHLGFVVVGSVALLADGSLSAEALTGALYQMINHGVSTGALFFLVGVIYERRHTRMLADFGGLASVMPWFAVILIVATLGSVGLPGTGGFVGEFLILLGTYQSSPVAAVMSATGVLLGAIYMLTLCRKLLFGPVTNEENKKLKDLSPLEFSYLVPLALLVIIMGVFPDFFLAKSKASISHLAKNYRNYSLAIDSH